MRRLFEATSLVLGGENWVTLAATETPIDSESGAEMAQTLQDLGSPGALLRAVVENGGTFGVSTIRVTEGQEIGPREWVFRECFQGGFAPFKEFCAFTAGMLAMLPRLFGLHAGEVIEEHCCCDGSPFCSFRLRWESAGDLIQERNYSDRDLIYWKDGSRHFNESLNQLFRPPTPQLDYRKYWTPPHVRCPPPPIFS